MPKTEADIECEIKALLASEPGTLYGAAGNAPRNAAGNRVFKAMVEAMTADVNAAGKEGEAIDGAAG